MDAKTLCLGVLTQGDASGYEIKKQLEEGPLAHFYGAGFGSIYPALTKLGEEGLVTCTELAQEKRPGKKVYRITERGTAAFREALRARPSGDWVRSDHLFLMFFSEFLDTGRLEQVYESYLAAYRDAVQRLRGMEAKRRHGGCRFVHAFGMHLYESMVEFMENNRDLLDADGPDREEAEKKAVGVVE